MDTTLTSTKGFVARRVNLEDSIRDGVPPPDVQEPEILLRGNVHHLYAEAESGKSWLALYLAREAMKRGETVVYLDMENGKRIVAERMQELDCDGLDVESFFNYTPYPLMDFTEEAVRQYSADIDDVEPDLIIFDSWVKFLSACNLEENSNDDIADWSTHYLHPAREREITTVVLDHVPHDAQRSRGASRKRDEVDVQWAVKKKLPFTRDKVGKLELSIRKDRESYLPNSVAFNIGGTEEGFIFERTDSTTTKNTTATNLKGKNKVGLDFLISRGSDGCTWNEFVKEVGSKGSASRVKTELVELDYMEQKEDGLWYYTELQNTINTEDIDRFQRFQNGSTELNGTGTP